MKRLVYINQVANYLAEGIVKAMLQKGGYDEVVMLIGNPENVTLNDPRVKIDRIAKYNRASFLSRTKSWLYATLQIQWKLLTKYRKADVFLVSNPPTAVFAMALATNKYKSLIYDIYPDGLVSGGFLGDKNPFIQFWKWYNKRYFRKAEQVYTITEGMADRLAQYIDKNKIRIVSLWSNPILQRIEKQDNEFVRQHHLEDKFIVMYSGNIGKTHNVELLIDAANILKSDTEIQFVIIGEGWAKDNIVTKVRQLGLHNVLILTYQPIEFISHSLSAADLSYISLDERISTVSVPSKTYNCLSVGSPLICVASELAELTKIVNGNAVGTVIHQESPEAIASFISMIKSERQEFAHMQNNAMTLSKQYTESNAEHFVKD